MSTPNELDASTYPTLAGVERPFYDYWSTHLLRDDDPHRQRWIEREEHAVELAAERTALIESVRPVDGARVLEIGCQNGAWLVALAREGADPTGIDVDELGIEAARIRAAAYGVDVRAEVASASTLPFGPDEFDVIASSCVIEHVPDKSAMIAECIRVLAPGGILVLSAPLRFSVKHLLSDPHYQHRGVSVLPGSMARWWLTTFRGETEYDVETLPTKRWVRRELTRRGMDLVPTPERFAGRRVPGPAIAQAVVDELRQVFTVIARKPASPLRKDRT